MNSNYYHEDSFNHSIEKIFHFADTFSMMHLNVRSIPCNLSKLSLYVSNLNINFDIIGLSETWLNDQVGGGLPVDLRVARKFTGTWSPYTHHAALSSLGYLGTSQKGKSHHMIQKTWAPYFFYTSSQYLLVSGCDNTWCSKH